MPCAVAALAGSSRHVMSGPTNANSLALFAVLAPLAAAGSPAYIQLALAVTVLVGLMRWLVGALRLGSLAHFISPSALFGFTSGAAVLIAVHALKDALGLPAPDSHGAGSLLLNLASHAGQAQAGSIIVTLATLGAALLVRRLDKRKPYMLAGLAAGTMAAALECVGGAGVPVLGAIALAAVPRAQRGLARAARPAQPGLRADHRGAGAVHLHRQGRGGALASASTRTANSWGRPVQHRRRLLLVLPVLRFAEPLRANFEAGARTPLAAVFSALLLVALVALSAPLLALIPHAAIAGLLLLVAWTLLDTPRWRRLLATQRGEAIAAATLAATVTIRMEVAILLGTVLSLMAYLHRTSRPAMRIMGFDGRGLDRRFVVMAQPPQPRPCPNARSSSCCAWRARCFGAAAHVAQRLHELRAAPDAPRHLLVMAKSMNFIDLAAPRSGKMSWPRGARWAATCISTGPAPRSWRCGGAPDSCNGWAKTISFPTRRQRCTRSTPGWTARCARAVRPGSSGSASRTARKRAAEDDARAGLGQAEAGAAKGRWRVRLEQG